jgi:vacuolar-type H+-ATPase subunit E/Vma4
MAERSQPGLAPLLETVEEEARRQAESQLEEARARAALRVAEAERVAQEVEAQAGAAGAAEGEREARRRVALARIEARRELLRLRETHVERAIELAVRRLDEELQGPEGAAFAARAVRAAARALGESRLVLRAAQVDRAALADALGAGAPAIEWDGEAAGAPGLVALSPDRHRMVDMTIDGVARRRRGDARRAAAAALAGRRGGP